MYGRAKRRVGTQVYPGPRRGWVKNEALLGASVDGAEVLDNWFPTAEGARLRGGSQKHATVGAAVKSIHAYRSGSAQKLFAATASDIYDITSPADPDVAPSAAVSSLTNGEWSSAHFSNSGGDYIIIANGADSVRHYNGTTWATPSITNVTSSGLSHVWAFKNRLFFVEKDTQSAWYLPVDAVAGAAVEMPLNGVFSLGGAVLFGATWSLDAGDGLDDVCLFVSDQGEVAVYQGTDPSSGSTWALSGVYRIGKPLGKDTWFNAGGDLAILTEDGIVSVADALNKDRAALMASAITRPIEDAWQGKVAGRSGAFGFSATLWHSKTMLLVGVPDDADQDTCFVANARTGAWCRFTGWDVQCSAVLDDQLYFGTSSSTVVKAESSGADQGAPFVARWLPKFVEPRAGNVSALLARLTARSSAAYHPFFQIFTDYLEGAWQAISSTMTTSSATWGTAVWGTDAWGGTGINTSKTNWEAVNGHGKALAPGIQVASSGSAKNELEIISAEIRYEVGSDI